MMRFLFLLIVVFILFLALIVEKVLIDRYRKTFKNLIIVNGTRGKSSVTEYIAAGMRGANISVLAKVTGVIPTIIFPDGTTKTIKRRNGARVKEQFRFLRFAKKSGVQNIILECMSLQQENQILESRFLKPDLYIITNIRDDHREVLGKSEYEQALTICSAIPQNSIIITAEKKYIEIIRNEVKIKNSRLIELEPQYFSSEYTGIIWENVLIAKKACELLGIDKNLCEENILSFARQKESQKLVINGNKNIEVYDGFAINDIPSAEKFIENIKNSNKENKEIVILLNTRSDRPLRSVQFSKWLAKSFSDNKIVLAGDHIKLTKRILIKYKLLNKNIFIPSAKQIERFAEYLNYVGENNFILICLGNIMGDGFKIKNALFGAPIERYQKI